MLFLISSSLTGHELLSELQQRRFNGSEGGGGGTAWSPMDDELLAQPQVMKLLDSLREQYTKYQEVCRQRSKRSQLEEIQTKVMQVKHWGGFIRVVNQKVKDPFQIAGLSCRKTVFRLPLVLFRHFWSLCLSQEVKLCCTLLFCQVHLRSLCTVVFYEHHMMRWSVSFICHPFCFICMFKYHWGLKEDILLHGVSSDCGWVLVLWWISSLAPQIEPFLVVLRTIQSLSCSTEKICHIILSQMVLRILLGSLTLFTPTKFPLRIWFP